MRLKIQPIPRRPLSRKTLRDVGGTPSVLASANADSLHQREHHPNRQFLDTRQHRKTTVGQGPDGRRPDKPCGREIAVDLGNRGREAGDGPDPGGRVPDGLARFGQGRCTDEKPQHRVRITKPFYLGKYLVTQEQWEAVMGSNPSHFKGPKNPVETVSWDDCQQFPRASSTRRPGRRDRKVRSCPPRRSGNMPAGRGARRGIALGTMSRGLGEYAWYARTRRQDASCWREEAERLGAVRHARERVGVVPGLVWSGYYANSPSGRSDGGYDGLVPRGSRRRLVRRRRVLPLGRPFSARKGTGFRFQQPGLPGRPSCGGQMRRVSGCRKDAVACRAERGRVAAAEASARRGQRCRAAVVLAEIEAGRLRNDVTLLAIEL